MTIVRWPITVTAKQKSHSTTNFTHDKTKLTRGKTKCTVAHNCHGTTNFTHGKTKLMGKQRKRLGQRLVSGCYLHLKGYVV